jgi:NDP-sugar pyrophosphorylase family protein
MAGGKGTRLLPNTESCPKPMLKIAGKPMLLHIIERAKFNGFEKFIIATHYLGKVIEEYFGDGRAFGVEIDYLRESKPLGTAGALGLIANAQNQPLIVTNGDVITDINYGELLDFHVNSIGTATVAVNSYEWQIPFGVVEIEGLNIIRIEEKPISKVYINAGIYVINPEVLAEIKSNSYLDMTSLLEKLKTKGHKIVAYPMHEPWRDIGRHEDLIAANK